MATLHDLPPELLQKVSELIHPVDKLPSPWTKTAKGMEGNYRQSIQALAVITRPCRSLTPTAKRCLYSRFETEYRKPLRGFLKRLIADEALGTSVMKHIMILRDSTYVKPETLIGYTVALQHCLKGTAPSIHILWNCGNICKRITRTSFDKTRSLWMDRLCIRSAFCT